MAIHTLFDQFVVNLKLTVLLLIANSTGCGSFWPADIGVPGAPAPIAPELSIKIDVGLAEMLVVVVVGVRPGVVEEAALVVGLWLVVIGVVSSDGLVVVG